MMFIPVQDTRTAQRSIQARRRRLRGGTRADRSDHEREETSGGSSRREGTKSGSRAGAPKTRGWSSAGGRRSAGEVSLAILPTLTPAGVAGVLSPPPQGADPTQGPASVT